jgi:hypothetical protein
LIAGSVDDIQPGSSEAHYFQLYFPKPPYMQVWYKGLENCVRVEEPGNPPVYVVDDHRVAYYSWHEARDMGYIERGATLIHIDKHSDAMEPFRGWVKGSDLKVHADYALNRLTALTFIVPAVAQGLIAQFWDFTVKPGEDLSFDVKGILRAPTSEVRKKLDLEDYFADTPCPMDIPKQRETTLGELISRHSEPQKLIIDIDLDAVIPLYGGNDSVFDQAAVFLAEIARKGGVVTVATSPGYADSDLAISLARDLAERII